MQGCVRVMAAAMTVAALAPGAHATTAAPAAEVPAPVTVGAAFAERRDNLGVTIPSDRAWEVTGGTAVTRDLRVTTPTAPSLAWEVTLGLVPTVLNRNVADQMALTHNAFPITATLADGSIMALYRSATKHGTTTACPERSTAPSHATVAARGAGPP